MADGVAITAGAGTTIATDDLGATGHAQWVKLLDGTNGGTDVIPGTAAKGLYVDPRGAGSRIQVASAGLTTATTAYTANDQLGTILTFANAVRSTAGTGVIQTATLVDKAKIVGAVDLYLFDRSVTLATDNAAADFSDADMLFCLGIINFPAPTTVTSNGFTQVLTGHFIQPSATSLFGALVTRAAHTFFGAAGDLVVSLGIAQD